MPTIVHKGRLVHECSVPGETRADDVFPAHPGGIQVSRNRFLFLYATRGWRGTDEDRSIIYQLRDGGFDGRIVREGLIARTQEDWDPYGDGKRLVKLHGQPQAFGVPKGAVIGGRPAPNQNVFVLKWRRGPKIRDPKTGILSRDRSEWPYLQWALGIDWLHFRLNDSEDDIEILVPPAPLREKGFENGLALCRAGSRWMNHGMAQPVTFNRDCTEWVECVTFDPSGDAYEPTKAKIGAVRYVFDHEKRLYEWVETGPLIGLPEASLGEPSVMPYKGDWLVVARTEFKTQGFAVSGPVWARTNDLFENVPEIVLPPHASPGPVAAYSCPDGAVRMVANCPKLAPDHRGRDPLFCFEIDPDTGFETAGVSVVFDILKEGLPIRQESAPVADMAKILPHAGGKEQFIVHRVRSGATYEGKTGVFINEQEKEVHGIYHAMLCYPESLPGAWEFD